MLKEKIKNPEKKYGHAPLAFNGPAFPEENKPEVAFIGTGVYGRLPITPEAL